MARIAGAVAEGICDGWTLSAGMYPVYWKQPCPREPDWELRPRKPGRKPKKSVN